MSKQKDVSKALGLLREQIDDTSLEAKERQNAARIILSFHKEAINRYQGKNSAEGAAVEAANRFRRVK